MKKEKRFERIYSQNTMSGPTVILVDKETGVNYLFYCQGGYSGGLTPLLDSEGKVVITPISKE